MDAPTLTTAYEIIRQPLGEILPRVSAALAPLVPHVDAAELSTHCAHSPFKALGGTELLTASELVPLLAAGVPGSPWQGVATIGGREREIVAVTSDATRRGAVLVLVREDGADPVGEAELGVAQALWDLVAAHFDRFATEALPGALARSRAAADTRARVISELTATHAAALSGVLGVLRSRALDDTTARATATDLAAAALIEMRAAQRRDRALAEEPVQDAFERLAGELRPMLRHSQIRLDLGAPDSDRSLAADVAHSARAIVRALLLIVLEQKSVSRIHVGWQLTEHELRATVRDDGAGALAPCDLGAGTIKDRLDVLGGRLDMDAVPSWGTTITAVIPLATPDAPAEAAHPLADLGEREVEVLRHLALGHRNRRIAETLHISESTVKFHVANILNKLGVGSRGEAAALFHAAA
ncbi:MULTISPECIES: helix-turn-helix transcriptional regulator [Streptomyces]|uniref:Transcriptional regulator, LuxR family n=1 Tax=Streptomyces venezuelae (strain ATCC 10712 / CBS 650.69 / DSM 40230 / JCM 4526 / NBRC 13096 / PD 04745) TaxID=953739 RepID=F2RA94_STRVP|nr:LuxR C-terminal-related transcriptional regulator [Streptomyces venezuelae]APE22400.1 helix-turn-helix transcriptional regulator [Streptomyces venezuelae]QER99785.1 helix-turn-helix transcriptional regulator [Streptomyces venezuelae ATCC 10712]CCA56576.1 transcriptional regulator, LuxR family [Streptomyces venezuelae ATCC 10712]